jgi:hypothetical protein
MMAMTDSPSLAKVGPVATSMGSRELARGSRVRVKARCGYSEAWPCSDQSATVASHVSVRERW